MVTLAEKTDSPLFGGGAYVAIDFEFSEIAKYIDNVGIGGHGYCFITDSGGNIIYHPQQQIIFSGLKTENTGLVKSLVDGVHYEENIIYTLNTTNDKLWRVVGVSFTDELAVERRTQIVVSIAFSFFFCAAIALVVLLIYSKIVNAPVRSLMRAMKSFESHADNFSYTGGTETVSEIRVLSLSFEHMAKTIQNLMDRVHREEKELRKTELKALQAQINPHFLFNTLNAGAQLAMMEGADKTVSFIENMADFFRYNIKKINEDTTIGEELKMVDSYIYILNVRFSGEIHYKKQVAEELEDVKVPSMILQPIVENAVNYGIRGLEREGIIEVSVYRDEPTDSICISVWDNGHGMTQERIQEVMEGRASENASSSNSNGIGLENVITRLQLYFDCDPGNHESEMRPEDVLTMQSDGAEQGTEVTIWIPNNH